MKIEDQPYLLSPGHAALAGMHRATICLDDLCFEICYIAVLKLIYCDGFVEIVKPFVIPCEFLVR